MVYISRRVEFCASHRLHNPEFSDAENDAIYGLCNNPNGHGHNYRLEVTVRGRVDPQTGMVMDLKRLKQVLEDVIVARVDHKHLNLDVDFMAGVIPTAENIAVAFWQILEQSLDGSCELYEVRVWENENNVAFYRGEGAELARHTGIAEAAQAGK
jgi:6-pyruvoyltetrahydropterin/6-carboxytetrahydropterin synthase